MAARSTTRKRAPARKTTVRKTTRKRAVRTLGKLEEDLPKSLSEFRRRMDKRLNQVEKQLQTAKADARKRWAKALREGSHQLGRIEAAGEKRWRTLAGKARREALTVLRRLEKAIEPPKAKRPARRRPRRPGARASREVGGSGI